MNTERREIAQLRKYRHYRTAVKTTPNPQIRLIWQHWAATKTKSIEKISNPSKRSNYTFKLEIETRIYQNKQNALQINFDQTNIRKSNFPIQHPVSQFPQIEEVDGFVITFFGCPSGQFNPHPH